MNKEIFQTLLEVSSIYYIKSNTNKDTESTFILWSAELKISVSSFSGNLFFHCCFEHGHVEFVLWPGISAVNPTYWNIKPMWIILHYHTHWNLYQYDKVIPANERTAVLQACFTLLVNKKYVSPEAIPPPIPFKNELRKQGIEPKSLPKIDAWI